MKIRVFFLGMRKNNAECSVFLLALSFPLLLLLSLPEQGNIAIISFKSNLFKNPFT